MKRNVYLILITVITILCIIAGTGYHLVRFGLSVAEGLPFFSEFIEAISDWDDDDDDDLRFDESDYLSFAASDYSENIGNIIGLKSKYRFTCGRFALFIANDPPTFTNPLIRPSGQLYVYRDDRGITDFGPIESRREKRYGPVHKYCKRRDEAILRVNNIWKP